MNLSNAFEFDGSAIVDGELATLRTSDEPVHSINPFSGEVLWKGYAADQKQVDNAVESSVKAAQKWKKVPEEDRISLVENFTKLVTENTAELTNLISAEAGKPHWEAKGEVRSLVTKFRASVQAYRARAQDTEQLVGGRLSRTRFLPIGVTAVLGPYNFPASMANSHIMPSIIAGNAVVFKPSELTPVTGLAVSHLWQQAGLPPGVLNCISGGPETAENLVCHPDIDGVFFVGSREAGRSILKSTYRHPEKLVALEMGGNSPLIVWDYDDISTVVHTLIQSTYLSAGQRCSAARRLIVSKSNEEVVPALLNALKQLRIGDHQSDPAPFYGPIIRQDHADRIESQIDLLVSSGASSLLTARRTGPLRTVVSPMVLNMTNCESDVDEEIFGPVLKIYYANDFDHSIDLANNTKFGLAAGIICRDRSRFEDFFNRVTAGIKNWNQPLTGATTFAPFGGMKQSGNFRPAGFMSCDYCSYPVASFEVENPSLPETLSPGIVL